MSDQHQRVESLHRPTLISAAIGILSLLLTAAGERRESLFSYLFAFFFWLTFTLGALFLQTMLHTTHARTFIVLRRPLEWTSVACVLFIPLFLPLAFNLRELYLWVDPDGLDPKLTELIAHKHAYLNVTFFLIRAVVYFAFWSAVALLLSRWSRAQDESKTDVTPKQRKLSAGSLPFLAITLSFAALDWVMSLEPRFVSTLYGVYIFAGAVVAMLSVLALLASFQVFSQSLSAAHLNQLGALLLAFVCFWAYCAWSQGMLLWVAGLPSESPWLLARSHAGWGALLVVLIVGHFALPFLALLSRAIKQNQVALALIAGLLVLLHAVDVYWLVLPALHPDTVHFHWTTITAWLGVGGLTLAFVLWRAGGQYALPVNDPYLLHSLGVRLHE